MTKNKSNSEKEYYLCSADVVKHFPDLEKSKPFKSGYAWSKEEYYVIASTDFPSISKYYDEKIKPDENYAGSFFLRPCCESQLDATKITQKDCKKYGLFVAIENALNLTKETNIAFAIYSLAGKYSLTPIEFINKIAA